MPSSFRMDRRSPRASRLKAAVSRKLLEFLGNYTDDVLAEYIVVLVCNGKHQNQAREDLEAFLGDDSEKFVAWLWHHLSEEIKLPKTPVDSQGLKADFTVTHDHDVNKEHTISRSMDLQIQSSEISEISLSNGGKYGSSNFFSTPNFSCDMKGLEGFPGKSPGGSASLAVVNTEELQTQTYRIDRTYGSTDDENHHEATKYRSSQVGCSSENAVGAEQFLQLEDSHQKIGRSKSNDPPCQPLLSSKRDSVSRNLRSVLTEDPHSRLQSMTKVAGRRLSPRVIQSVSHQNISSRGSVWDRLGKPCEGTDVLVNQEVYQQGTGIMKRKEMDHTGDGLDKHRLVSTVPGARLSKRLIGDTAVIDGSYAKLISNNQAAEYRTTEQNVDTMETCNYTVTYRLKSQVGEKDSGNGSSDLSNYRDNHLQDKQPHQKLQKILSSNSVHKESYQGIAENNLLNKKSCHSLKPGKVLLNPRSNELSRPQLKREASVVTPMQIPIPDNSSLQSRPKPYSNAERANASHKPVQNEVLDVKLRLCQIEKEMLELRSKQAEMSSDTKFNASLSSGTRNQSEEDVESRTAFVANVHFASPKEALSSHFTQCGLVARVILLTDTITGLPNGSAYIVFANKESVDKAISLSGTSFFSRTLKVMRKTEMPAGFLASRQAAGQPPQPCHPPQSHGAKNSQRPFSSSHLQWRRGQSANGEKSISATTTLGLKISTAALCSSEAFTVV